MSVIMQPYKVREYQAFPLQLLFHFKKQIAKDGREIKILLSSEPEGKIMLIYSL